MDRGGHGTSTMPTESPVSRDQKTLYVDETVGNCILKFDIEPDGTLRHRSNFALLNLLVPNRVENWWLGPDSLKVDSKGDLYVAQWFGAKILKISPAGKLLHVFRIRSGNGTTTSRSGRAKKSSTYRSSRTRTTRMRSAASSSIQQSIEAITNVRFQPNRPSRLRYGQV